MLTDSEYCATICEQSVENIKHQAAQIAKRFQDLGISKEVTIIEEKATRMVSVPKKVFGITISGKVIHL